MAILDFEGLVAHVVSPSGPTGPLINGHINNDLANSLIDRQSPTTVQLSDSWLVADTKGQIGKDLQAVTPRPPI